MYVCNPSESESTKILMNLINEAKACISPETLERRTSLIKTISLLIGKIEGTPNAELLMPFLPNLGAVIYDKATVELSEDKQIYVRARDFRWATFKSLNMLDAILELKDIDLIKLVIDRNGRAPLSKEDIGKIFQLNNEELIVLILKDLDEQSLINYLPVICQHVTSREIIENLLLQHERLLSYNKTTAFPVESKQHEILCTVRSCLNQAFKDVQSNSFQNADLFFDWTFKTEPSFVIKYISTQLIHINFERTKSKSTSTPAVSTPETKSAANEKALIKFIQYAIYKISYVLTHPEATLRDKEILPQFETQILQHVLGFHPDFSELFINKEEQDKFIDFFAPGATPTMAITMLKLAGTATTSTTSSTFFAPAKTAATTLSSTTATLT